MGRNVTVIVSGGQVGYRLCGDHSASLEQVEYRLGEVCDARSVSWVGSGDTARVLGVQAGLPVGGQVDVGRVYALMGGVNPGSGEVLVRPKLAVPDTAKVRAVNLYDAVHLAAFEQGVEDPGGLFGSGNHRRAWGQLARGVERVGDSYLARADTVAELARDVGVDPAGLYPAGVFDAAFAARGERVRVGVMGYDVRFDLPKSVSLAIITAEPSARVELLELWRTTCAATLDRLAVRVAHGASGHHGDGQVASRVEGTGYAGTLTVEATSRAGDPHVHAHSMIANLTICVDGVPRTIAAGGKDVFAHGPWANETNYAAFRHAAVERGLLEFEWSPSEVCYQARLINPVAEALFSKRHTAIVENRDLIPTGGTAGRRVADRVAEAATRPAKHVEVESLGEIEGRVFAELARTGIPLYTTTRTLDHGRDLGRVPGLWSVDDWVARVEADVTEHRAVFTATDVATRVAHYQPDTWTPAEAELLVEDILTHPALLKAVDPAINTRLTGGSRYTSRELLEAEATIYRVGVDGQRNGRHHLTIDQAARALTEYQEATGVVLNAAQHTMYGRFTTSDNLVELAVGPAGTGKTTVLDAVRHAFESNGVRVFGISTAALAAANLGSEAGIEVSSAAALRAAIGRGDQPRCDVLFWDEYSMAGAREQAPILQWAQAHGVDVRAVGDPKQLDSVAAGSTFHDQLAQLGAVELVENMRQRAPHEREAVSRLRDGDSTGALGIYAEHDQLVVTATPAARDRAMIEGWARDAGLHNHRAGVTPGLARMGHVVILAHHNDHIDTLNTLARHHARHQGWLTTPDVTYRSSRGPVEYAVGDQIMLKHNQYQHGHGPDLRNGTRGIVTAIEEMDRAMTVTWTDTNHTMITAVLDAAYVAEHTRHAYAITNHQAQGQTIDRTHTDPAGLDRNALYVQLTRDRHAVTLYATITDLDPHGLHRQQLDQMDNRQRARWAAGELGATIDEHGWERTETAHHATNTPTPEPVKTAEPPAPRLVLRAIVPDWYSDLVERLYDWREQTVTEWARHHDQRDAAIARVAELAAQIETAEQHVSPFREQLATTKTIERHAQEALWAANRAHTGADGYLDKRRTRKTLEHATNVYADAKHDTAVVTRAVAPHLEPVERLHTALDHARRHARSFDTLDRYQTSPAHIDRHIDAVETWHDWAAGHPVNKQDLIEAVEFLHTTGHRAGWDSLERVQYPSMADSVADWAIHHEIDIDLPQLRPPQLQRPGPELDLDLGL